MSKPRNGADAIRDALEKSATHLAAEINQRNAAFAEDNGLVPVELNSETANDQRIADCILSLSREVPEAKLVPLVEAIIGRKLPRSSVVHGTPLTAVRVGDRTFVATGGGQGIATEGAKVALPPSKTGFRMATPDEVKDFCSQAGNPVMVQLLTLIDVAK